MCCTWFVIVTIHVNTNDVGKLVSTFWTYHRRWINSGFRISNDNVFLH
jgi:hypothetical protein